ncbi:hypothetical protein N8H10_17940 [Curtobacterium flaccumfaciens pv. poinsettiae]|nr:hypothetical protein [Curtobacterium flaccumfaciens pv. poinsettiae]
MFARIWDAAAAGRSSSKATRRACGASKHKGAIGHGIGQYGMHGGSLQDIFSACRTPVSMFIKLALGATRTKRDIPIVFMARAAAPMLLDAGYQQGQNADAGMQTS